MNYEDLEEVLKKTRGVIEYLDTDEMNNSLLLNNINEKDEMLNYSHWYTYPLIMGILGFTLPAVSTSQAPVMYMEQVKLSNQ